MRAPPALPFDRDQHSISAERARCAECKVQLVGDSVMSASSIWNKRRGLRPTVVMILALLAPSLAHAVPSFARQTGQNCVACHAGGQFPELTPYGRLFKLTAYTIGTRAVPLSAMGLVGYTKTRNTTGTDSADFPKDGALAFQAGSLFLAGKITDNLGLFAQWTFDPYATQNGDSQFIGHSQIDNTELRYADRFISPERDLIVGAFLNNNPSMQDVWNSTPAWGYPYVSSSFSQGAAAAPLIESLGQSVAGTGIYAYWNRTIYGELSLYRTANGFWSLLSKGVADADTTKLKGANPYWRLALSHEWGPHNLMVGTFGLDARVYSDPLDAAGPTDHYRNYGLDAQYQYLLDPHTVTAQASYIHEKASWSEAKGATNSSDKLDEFKLKGTYIYGAKYGASLTYFNLSGDTDAALYQSSSTDPAVGITPLGNLSGNPGTRAWIPEVFWTPIQYLRIGAQYWHFTRFNGSSGDYDGNGRRPRDNDTLFLYAWGAF
jgi:hypothetical protein